MPPPIPSVHPMSFGQASQFMVAEKEKMLSGVIYDSSDPLLVAERHHAHAVCRSFNAHINLDDDVLKSLLSLFGSVEPGLYIESPFFCDYGYNIHLGARTYFNVNVTILDCAPVTIGSDVKFGPSVQLYTAGHSLDPLARAQGEEFALPITIGNKVWIGGSAIVLPGVTIGHNSVIGAGAVVTKDVPDNAIAAGNPARVMRTL